MNSEELKSLIRTFEWCVEEFCYLRQHGHSSLQSVKDRNEKLLSEIYKAIDDNYSNVGGINSDVDK